MFDSGVEIFATAVEYLRELLENVPGFQAAASAPYMFRPFIVLLVLGIVSGCVGVLVNLRGLEFISEGMVHSVFPGIVGGFVYLGGIEGIIPGSVMVAFLAALAYTFMGRRGSTDEAAIAVVLTGFFGVGIVMITHHRDMSGQLESLLFGRLLDVTDKSMLSAVLVCLFALLLVVLTWKEQVLRAFDPVGTAAMGYRVILIDLILNLAIAMVVVAASAAVGTLLVIGYLIIPGATARLLSLRIETMVPISCAVAVGGGWLGIIVIDAASAYPFSPQAAVIGCLTLIYALGQVAYWIKRALNLSEVGGSVTGKNLPKKLDRAIEILEVVES